MVECPRRSDLARPASSGPLAPVGSSVDAHPDKDTAPWSHPDASGFDRQLSGATYRILFESRGQFWVLFGRDEPEPPSKGRNCLEVG